MRYKLQIILLILSFSQCSHTQDELAKDFPFYHDNGELQNLSDYQGKVVYISFWASWCKPCLVNFEKYYTIRKDLQEMGVVLLNVNLDKDPAKWHESLGKNQTLIGDNVRSDQINDLMSLYNLTYIPAYEIVDKKGTIVYLPQDGNRDINDAFQEWVKE